MREAFVLISEGAILLIDAFALAVILLGTAQAFVSSLREMVKPLPGHERREVWLRYARWLVAALTFQLAADIVETAITSSWEALARMAMVAAIRSALNWLLERDLAETRERDRETKRE